MNRCLTEGRRALLVRVAGIEGGVECGRFVPLLSALADGEARAEELALLRPHMKTCLSCRARLKEFRAAPGRVAALVPPVAVAAAGAGSGAVRGALESLVGAAQHKAAAVGERAQAAVELATGQKVAAVAASAAALAGGGTAVHRFAGHEPPRPPPSEQTAETKPVAEETPVVSPPAPTPVSEQPVATEPAPAPTPEPSPAPPAPIQPAGNGFAPASAGATGSGTAGGNEFGP